MSFPLNGIVNISGGDYNSTGGNTIDEASYGGNVIGSANTVTNSPYATVLANDSTITDSTLATILGGQSKTITTSPGNLILSSNDDNFSVTGNTNQGIHLYTSGYVHNYGGEIKKLAQSPAGAYASGLHSTAGTPTGTVDTNARPYDEGALMFDSTNKKLYIFKSGAWAEAIITVQPAESLSTTLVTGNTSGANDIIVSASRQIRYDAGVRVGLAGDAPAVASSTIYVGDGNIGLAPNAVAAGRGITGTVANDHSVMVGAFVASGGAYGQTLVGANTVGAAGADYGVALGLGCEANAVNSGAIGHNTITNVTGQYKIGNDSTTHIYGPGFIKSDLQKSSAAGITPGVSALQSVTSGSGATTIQIKDTLFDWSTPMVSGNTILLSDLTQIWHASALIRGTYVSNPTVQTFSVTMFWFDGTSNKTLAQQDVYVAVNAPTFNVTLATGLKSNGASGQYVFCSITNTSGATMNITHYRVSVTRVA